MNVTLVVSGLPNNAPLRELARNISKITDIKNVGAFRVREIPVDSDRRLVGLDFEDGFNAMDALLVLDGVKYKMGDGNQYMLKCKISKNAQHLPYYNDLSESYIVNDGRQSRNYEGGCNSLVPFNETEIRNENAKLSAHLHLLEKKKMIVEAERELLRAKKKLKKEYYSKTDSDSEDDRCHKCPKASGRHTPTKYHRSPSTSRKESKCKRKKKKNSKKSKSISRRSRSKSTTSRSRSPMLEDISSASESRSRSPSKALNVFRSSPKIYKSERLSATVTTSSFRKESTKRKRSRSRSKRSDSRSRRSQSRTWRSQSISRQSQYISKRSQSRSRRSQSRSRRLQYKARRSQSRSRRAQSPREQSRRSRSQSWSSEFKSKRLESEYSYSSRNYRARNAVTEIVNIKNYNKHIYLEKKYCRSNDTSTVTKEEQHLMRESAKRVEDAAYLVIREIDNLVDYEKQSLDKNDVKIVRGEFKNYVKTEFNKIKTELDKRMSPNEIVRFYRGRRSIEEDKAFLLKLIGELIPKHAKDTVDEKNDDTTQRQRRRSIEMWNEVEEVLQEIPMDILQDVEDDVQEINSSDPSSQNEESQININIRVSHARPTQENCAKVTDNSSSVSTLNNTLKHNNNENVKKNKIQNEKNNIDNDRPESTDTENKTSKLNMGIKAKDNDNPKNVSEICCIDLTNDEGISEDNEVSKPHSNIVSKTNKKELSPVEICTDLLEKKVPQNSRFIIPVKRLMSQMKSHIKECKNAHETIQTALRARLVDLLKDKKNYLKTPQIIILYRSRYPKESDKLFIDEILENMNKEKSDELPTMIPIVVE